MMFTWLGPIKDRYAFYITGLPWLGKTQKAKEMMKTDAPWGHWRAYISSDIIRTMFPNAKQKDITWLKGLLYERAFNKKYDIIIEEPHQAIHYTEDIWYDTLVKRGYIIAHYDMNLMFVAPLRTSHFNREREIPFPILDEQYLRYLANSKNASPINAEAIRWIFWNKNSVYFVDLDGTLFDTTAKFTHPKATNADGINWKFIFSREGILLDKFRKDVYDKVPKDAILIIVSWRPATKEVWDITYQNLRDAGIDWEVKFYLFRSPKDARSDEIIKEELFNIIKSIAPHWIKFYALDDRKRVIDMRERNGVEVTNCSMLEDNDF